MKLKQEDRRLLREFFSAQSVWMRENSLLNSKNLNEFYRRFLDFKKSKKCEENLACRLFELALEHELLKCEERSLIAQYETNVSRGISKLQIYASSVKPATDNSSILWWIKESKIVCDISASDIATLNRSIEKKLAQNANERMEASRLAKDFVVR